MGYTLEQQIEPEAQLQLSMQERVSIVPAEVLYHSRRDDAHHRVYVHRSEETMLVTDNHQVDRSFIQEESFNQLRRSRMQYIHLGVLQVRVQILHRQRERTMALIVFRDNRWQGDQAILATMEVDLTSESQMIYVIPEIMMTIGDFYRNIQISILTRGYEVWQNSEANLLITRGLVGRLSNTPNVGFAYEIQGVVDYLTSHGVNALPGRSFSTRSLQGTADEYYEEYGDIDDYIEKGKQIIDQDERQTEGSAGLDISASHGAIIEPYGRDLVHTGLRIEIPYGYYGRLASRSGLAWKSGVEVGVGVIDSDYRGEVKVLLCNRTNIPIYISPQQKIAQLIPEKIALPEVYEVPHLSYSERANDIFSLLMPQETVAVLVQDDSIQNNSEQDQAATTSPWASVPRSLDPTPNYEDTDDSYLDYIAYLASLSTSNKPIWDDYLESDTEWINLFASKGGGESELIAANCEMEYPSLRHRSDGGSNCSRWKEVYVDFDRSLNHRLSQMQCG
ncbi:hypothetical protein ZIOFF_022078 [Zingiber officinale]|uniref:dUTP diphosphatase n=1 Tax=Zingiber officinale TaxID=94328 RepID=A0A8J5LJX8_ZINOF|nr:hypothetical protein ZIOFF_022078 [Zingiber officinale]